MTKKAKKRVVIAVAVCGVFVGLYFGGVWAARGQRVRRARRLVAKFKAQPESEKAFQLALMLSFGNLPKDVGDEVLLALVEPEVVTRGAYAFGKPINVVMRSKRQVHANFYGLASEQICDSSFRGKPSGGATSGPGTGGGSFSPMKWPLDLSQRIKKPGTYPGEVRYRFKLYPLIGEVKPESLRRADRGWLVNLVMPFSYYVKNGSIDRKAGPKYEVNLTLPFEVKVVPPGQEEKVKLISNPELDAKMKAIFKDAIRKSARARETAGFHSNAWHITCAGGLYVKEYLENRAFRYAFRDERGRVFPLDYRRVIEAGDYVAPAMPLRPLVKILPPGTHKGHFILTPDAEAAYPHPHIKTIWNGTVEVPVTVTITKKGGENE